MTAVETPLAGDPWSHVAEALDPTPHPHLADPVGWARVNLVHGYLWSKQREVCQSVVDNRYTAVPSCFDIGKSYVASLIACWWLDVHPPGTAFVVTTAPTDSQVKAILWREIRSRFRDASDNGTPLRGRITQDAQWKLDDGALIAYGRKPADHDGAAFQGIHALYVLVIIDEADGVPQALYDAADGLVTNEHSRMLGIGNPYDPTSPFAAACKPGSGWHVIRISVWDSPNFTNEAVPTYLPPLLVSRQWVKEREKRWGRGSPRWQSKVEGRWPRISDDTLIDPAWIERAIHQDLTPNPKDSSYGLDVARYGTDKTVAYLRQGGHVRRVMERTKQSTMRTAGAISRLVQRNPMRPTVNVDDDGVGGGVTDRLDELGLGVRRMRNGARPLDPDQFGNARSEWYWALRDAFEAGEVDMDGADDDLASQLGSIKFKLDSRGKIWVESKEDMRKRGLPSPDRADAFCYSWVKGVSMPDDGPGSDGWVPGITDDLMDRPL